MAKQQIAEPAGAPLSARVREASRLNDAEAARERVDELLVGKPGARLKALLPPDSLPRRLIEGIADGSPFLWDIVRADPAVLATLLEQLPEASLDRLVDTAL